MENRLESNSGRTEGGRGRMDSPVHEASLANHLAVYDALLPLSKSD